MIRTLERLANVGNWLEGTTGQYSATFFTGNSVLMDNVLYYELEVDRGKKRRMSFEIGIEVTKHSTLWAEEVFESTQLNFSCTAEGKLSQKELKTVVRKLKKEKEFFLNIFPGFRPFKVKVGKSKALI